MCRDERRNFHCWFLASLLLIITCCFTFVQWSASEINGTVRWYYDTVQQRAGASPVFDFPTSSNFENDNSKKQDSVALGNDFPELDDIIEMAYLSGLIYDFQRESDEETVCRNINEKKHATTVDGYENDIYCHWYHHDHNTGTQVMIVSSIAKSYLSVVFAGTDDLKTALTDADICMKPFGVAKNSSQSTTIPSSEGGDRIRIHEGFNNAVFGDDLFDQIMTHVDKWKHKFSRLFTTGHSLGGANSVITAVGMALHYHNNDKNKKHGKMKTNINSISFGCPYIGKTQWKEFVDNSNIMSSVGIWRVVLGWDIVARLPEFMDHVGHTIQLGYTDFEFAKSVSAYYQHYGNKTLGYDSVPTGWDAKPYIFVPGALYSHAMKNYWKFLLEWTSPTLVDEFVRTNETADANTANKKWWQRLYPDTSIAQMT